MSFNDWKLVRLGDICIVNQKTYSLSENWPFVNYLDTGNVTENRIYDIQHIVIGQDALPSRARRKVDIDDIIYSTVRPNQKHYAIIKNKLPNMLVSTGFAVITVDKKVADSDFVYYFLTQTSIVDKLHSIAEQSVSTYPSIKPSDIENIELMLPPLDEQKQIGCLFRILDDKIAINTAINQRLEQIAQAIFKSWFMDNVTDDWFYVNLGSVTTEIRTRVKEKELPVLSAVKTGNLVLSEDYFTKQVYSKDISKYIVVAPNNFAYNPARINIGSIGINDFDFTGCVSPVYVVFRTEPEYHHFFRFFIKSSNFQEEVRVRASGSVRQSLNYRDFALIEVIYPPIDVVRRFNSLYEPIHTMQRYLEEENTHLAAIRDALLPRLMSGELSVAELGAFRILRG